MLYGDKAYYKADDQAQWEASGGTYRVNKSGKLSAKLDRINAAAPACGRASSIPFTW